MAARGAIAVQVINKSNGAVATEAAIGAGGVADGLYMNNDGQTLLVVHNLGADVLTVTVKAVACEHGRTVDLASGNIAVAGIYVAGPFPPGIWNLSSGVINVDFGGAGVSAVNTKVGAIRLG